jgi:tetratricopeptide (TPR) repeat protein
VVVSETALGRIAAQIQTGEPRKADVLASRLLRDATSSDVRAKALLYRGHARMMEGRSDAAIADLEAARDLSGEIAASNPFLEVWADAHLARYELAAIGFAEKSDLLTAQDTYEKIRAEDPTYANLGWVCYQLGRVYLVLGRSDEANTQFRTALIAPSTQRSLTAYSYERLAFIMFYELRQREQAITFLDKALDTYPDSAARIWTAQVLLLKSRVLGRKELAAALDAVSRAITIASAVGSATDNGVLAEALFRHAELLAQVPGEAHNVIAQLQRYLTIVRRPIGIDVTLSRVYELLGETHEQLQNYREAVLAYRTAQQYNPDNPWEESLTIRIAQIQYRLGDMEEVIATLAEATDRAHAHRDTLFQISVLVADAHYRLNNFPSAMTNYRAAMDAAPEAEVRARLQQYYQRAVQQMGTQAITPGIGEGAKG